MTLQETQKLLVILKKAYPRYYMESTKEEVEETLMFYHDMFKDYPVEVVATALKNYVKVNKYPPTIAGIIEQIELLTDNNTAETLWTAIEKAVRNSTYNSVEEFEKLPPECKQFIGSARALKELGQMDGGTLNTVTKGQFIRTVGDIKRRTKAREDYKKLDSGLFLESIED